MPNQSASWVGGRTYVFQGTVLLDGTAGTHIASLTVVPGAGNELELVYGQMTNAGSATLGVDVLIDDGANTVTELVAASTAATYRFPQSLSSAIQAGPGARYLISGTMRLRLIAQTSTVSVTQIFAVVLRVWGDSPTFTLADSVGSPTLTTNTSGFF